MDITHYTVFICFNLLSNLIEYLNYSDLLNAGRSFLQENEYCLEIKDKNYESIKFGVTYKVGAPFTIKLHNRDYEEISIDFGNKILLFITSYSF